MANKQNNKTTNQSKVNKRFIVFSGAGLSAESGMRTFRGPNGIWKQFDVDRICNIHTWYDNYQEVHAFYDHYRIRLATQKPNAMHQQMGLWQKKYGDNFFIISQNCDDFLERSNCTKVVHVHGELTKMKCMHCGHVFEIGYKAFDHTNCAKCDGITIKPQVVFFRETVPLYAVMYELFASLTANDLVLIIGTSGTVISVNDLLVNKPSYHILNNLTPEKLIDEKLFHHKFYCPATQAIEPINKLVQMFMGY